MANLGKNKLVKYARFYADGYNISGDAQNVGSLGIGYGEVDMTGWGNVSKQTLTDKLLMGGIENFQAFMNDAADGAFTQLKDSAAGKEVAVLFGGNAEPTYGDPAYLLASAQTSANITFNAGAAIINANFRMDTILYNEWPLGNVISPEISQVATYQGDSYNAGGATANGWHAVLHVVASSAYTQPSPDPI